MLYLDCFTKYADLKDFPAYTPIESTYSPQEIVDFIASEVRRGETPMLTICTMCDTPVNFVGHLINAGVLSSGDVVIAVVSNGSVKRYYYDADGSIINWPYGLLNADFYSAIGNIK